MKTRIANFRKPASGSRFSSIVSFAGLLLLLCFANSAGARELTGCQDITAPGLYVVGGNLLQTQAYASCLNIHDTQNVRLDCGQHTVTGGYYGPAISVTNVQGFAISNCTLVAPVGVYILTASSSSNGAFSGNTVGNLDSPSQYISFTSVNNTKLVGNTINAGFQQYYSSGNVFRSNMATCPKNQTCAAVFVSALGSNNTMVQNQIDGQGSASSDPYGADDGIVIEDESGDVLAGNTIRNTWDTGIETLGNIVDLHIKSNTIANVAYAGIGGWYWNSWKDVRVIDNTVSNTPQLFALLRICGLRPQNWDGHGAPADTAVYFQGNLFSGNQFDGSEPGSYSAEIPIYDELNYPHETQVCGIPGEQPVQSSDFKLHNNVFTQNNFGHVQLAPYFSSPIRIGDIEDGGGNVCLNPGSVYPLACD
jgi:Right handed beta helix region